MARRKNAAPRELAAQAQEAWKVGKVGKLRRYVALLRKAAARGDAASLEELGGHLRDGLRTRSGVVVLRPNARAALRCFRRAAELGDTRAMTALGVQLAAQSRKLPQGAARRSVAEAMRWEKKAKRLGDRTAQFNLAMSYLMARRPAAAFRELLALERAGDVSASVELAKAQLAGVGARRDVEGAIARLERVARDHKWVSGFDRGLAMLQLALVHYDGWQTPRNFDVTLKWLRHAEKHGSAAAAGLLKDLQPLD